MKAFKTLRATSMYHREMFLMEELLLREAITKCATVAAMGRYLGLDRATVYSKLRAHGVDPTAPRHGFTMKAAFLRQLGKGERICE